ncbi:dihydroorotase [Streptosporangium violaceochromogenes]|nr:dihydroorotase [Streptosporangium violaceochromogenes]
MPQKIRFRDGIIQTPDGPLEQDLQIEGDRVAALLGRDERSDAGVTDFDASGLWIMPGIVDLHAHTRVPGYEHKEDYVTASRAAARGGITTFVDMPNVDPPTTTVELLREKRAVAERDCLVDWGHFAAATDLEQVPRLAKAGAMGFKLYQLKGAYPHDPRLAVDDPATLYETFKAIKETGLPCLVHPCSQSLLEHLYSTALESGSPKDVTTFSRTYSSEVIWSVGVAILMAVQRATGVRLHLVHTHAADVINQLRTAKANGFSVTAACDPKYFHMRMEDLETAGARGIPGGFISEDEGRMAEVWRALDDGTIDIIDADHGAHTLEEMARTTNDPRSGPIGGPQYEYLLSVFLNDVNEGKLRIARLVDLLCRRPAQIIGLYPNKGSLEPGASADIVVVDPRRKVHPLDERTENKSGWTPYHGRTLTGGPVLTMLRGQIIAENETIVGEPGFGRHIGRDSLKDG